jgi:hypothetical protein
MKQMRTVVVTQTEVAKLVWSGYDKDGDDVVAVNKQGGPER